MLMINSIELIKLGCTQQEASYTMQKLCMALPTYTIVMMIEYKLKNRTYEGQKGIRHVRLDDAIKLCDERIENRCNISSVNKEFWADLKNRLAKINQQ